MEYKIIGDMMPVVICNIEEGRSVICEKGAMKWMSPNMNMQTEAGAKTFGRAFGRMFSGEHLFQNVYTAQGGPGTIAFGSFIPGSIRAIHVTPDKPIICQKSSFLAAEDSIELSVFYQKRIATALFGGEGFIMQKLEGEGLVFISIDGASVEYDLKEGQQIIISTGHLAMIDSTCSIDVQSVKGVKNKLFGGEGFFNTVVTGPGHIVLQTMPLANLSAAVASSLPSTS